MTRDEVRERLMAVPKGERLRVAKEAGFGYRWMCHMIDGHIKNPGSDQMDKARAYFRRRRRA
jgi:hypothetical protein